MAKYVHIHTRIIFIHTCMYMNVYVCILCMCCFLRMYMNVLYVFVCIVSICMYCMYLNLSVCIICICMYVRICPYCMHQYMYVYINIYVRIYQYMYVYVSICMYVCICTYYTYLYIYICISQRHIFRYMQINAYTDNTYIYIHYIGYVHCTNIRICMYFCQNMHK